MIDRFEKRMNDKYVIRQDGQFILSDAAVEDEFAAVLHSPLIFEKGSESENNTEDFSTIEHISDYGNGLFRRHFCITNYSNFIKTIHIALTAETGFQPDHWLIPCVLYNGNSYGEHNSPKGLEMNSLPWVFSYDRSGIPSCTLSENSLMTFSTFASDRDSASLRSSSSLRKLHDGRFCHSLYYPIIEAPVSYVGKNKMTEPYYEYITLPPGGSFEAESFFYVACPRWPKYGFYNLINRVLPIFRHDHLPVMRYEMVKSVCMNFLHNSRAEYKGVVYYGASYRDYTHPIGNEQLGGPWDKFTLRMIEENPSLNHLLREECGTGMGFTAQGFMIMRMLLKESFQTGNMDLQNEVLRIMDDWTSRQQQNGLVYTTYPRSDETVDLSNLGWGVSESVKIYTILKANNVDRQEYLEFSERICSFFIDHYKDDDPFGQIWTIAGVKLKSGGCTGSFMVKALLELYFVCKKQIYLEYARKAYDFYFTNELDAFRCSAGAIDCDSVDKESSYPFIYSGLALYRETGNPRYLECAEKAATYFLSWMFCYDAIYQADSDFSALGYHTSGGTVVSTEHACIDPYASIVVPDLYDLAQATGNRLWWEAGRMIWINSIQCVAGPNGCFMHGMMRPAGAQNECFAQARWTKYRSSPETRGHLNDFIGIWLCCFKLYTIDRLDDPLNENYNSLSNDSSQHISMQMR